MPVVKLLLASGANVEAADKGGWTPLYVAASSGHVEVTKLLLSSGANIEAVTRSGWTPLFTAAYQVGGCALAGLFSRFVCYQDKDRHSPWIWTPS